MAEFRSSVLSLQLINLIPLLPKLKNLQSKILEEVVPEKTIPLPPQSQSGEANEIFSILTFFLPIACNKSKQEEPEIIVASPLPSKVTLLHGIIRVSPIG